MSERHVLTGAPGAGKTEIGLALRASGYVVVAEAATDVIADEQASGVDEPWQGDDFLDKIVTLQKQRQSEAAAAGAAVQVFDRSPLCTLALARYLDRPVTLLLAGEVARIVEERVYQPEVFLVRPLGFVTPTAARRISYADSLKFQALHEAVYLEHGFRLIDVPTGTVSVRAAFVDSYIRSLRHCPPGWVDGMD